MTDLITQPTASVDAEQVWREARAAHEGGADTAEGKLLRAIFGEKEANQAAAAVIQAYGDARADAARREALEEASKVARDYASKAAQRGWVLKPGSIVTAARHIATTIRALKENPNAG